MFNSIQDMARTVKLGTELRSGKSRCVDAAAAQYTVQIKLHFYFTCWDKPNTDPHVWCEHDGRILGITWFLCKNFPDPRKNNIGFQKASEKKIAAPLIPLWTCRSSFKFTFPVLTLQLHTQNKYINVGYQSSKSGVTSSWCRQIWDVCGNTFFT